MAKTLLHNTVVRQATAVGELVCLMAGTEAPDWAVPMLGDHLFTETPEREPVVAQTGPADLPQGTPEPEAQPEAELEVPKRNAAKATWKNFAESNGLVIPASMSRDEIIEEVIESIPELASQLGADESEEG